MKKNNLIITGALGHIGSYLIHNFNFNKFNKIILIDNLLTQRYISLYNLKKRKKFEFHQIDINDNFLEKLINVNDTILHLAAITDAQSSIEKYKEVEKVNYIGTKKIIDICIKKKCMLIFPSSTSVYGSQKSIVDEECKNKDLLPQSPYAYFKLKSEKMLLRLSKKTKIKFVILRLGTIFGTSKGMRFHTAVNKFCWQASLNLPITIWSTAYNQNRPYLDLVDFKNIIDIIFKKKLYNNQIYNVLTINCSVKKIVNIIKLKKSNIKIKYVNSEIMNQLSYNVSTSKIRKIGFITKGNIKKGIFETMSILK